MFDDRDWRAMCRRMSCALVRIGLPNRDSAPVDSQRVRNARFGGDSVVFNALRIAGERTRHPEMRDVGIVFFGLSASGNFGLTFAGAHPERTIGVIRYHSHLRGGGVDTAILARIPSLTIVGANDAQDIANDSRALWRALRGRDAPAAFVSHVAAPHVTIDALVEAGAAMRPWIEAIVEQHASSSSPSAGWLVDDSAVMLSPATALTGSPARASWLPGAKAAFAVRQLAGLCAAVGLSDATTLLGEGTRLVSDVVNECHYTHTDPQRDLWLSASSHGSEAGAIAWLAQAQRSIPLADIGTAAHLVASARSSCSTIGAVRSEWTFFVSACGPGLGLDSDSTRLRPLAKQLIGER